MAKRLSPDKAAEILRHGYVHGKQLTPEQRRFFRHVAGKKNSKGKLRGPRRKKSLGGHYGPG